jgi:hypothetical protein
MVKKNYGCESNDSCSLVSVTGISANSSCSESYSSTTRCNDNRCKPSSSSCSNSSSNSSSSSSSSSCSTSSSSSCLGSSSSSCSSSSEQTYSDCSTNRTTDTQSCLSSCSGSGSSSNICSYPVPNKCDSVDSALCEPQNGKNCERLVKKYICAKEELLAFSDIIVVLNFIKNKLTAVQPNIDLRRVEKHSVEDNIKWLECFVDTLFCVLRKNESYKVIKVRDCKLKNDSELITDNRTYLVKVKYCTKAGESCRNIPLVFKWSQLTNNDAKSYKAVLGYVIHQLEEYIKGYQAASTVPFLC